MNNPWMEGSKSKYQSKKIEIDGIIFASRREAKYYEKYKYLKAIGEIKDFKMQVPFELIPAQRAEVTVFDKKGMAKRKEKTVEMACKYIADFVIEHDDGTTEVIDVKGFPTPVFGIKKKLMRYVHGIAITEVK